MRNTNTPFPVAMLPKAVADICKEISNSFEVPLELPCVTALGLLAACCQKKSIVRVNKSYSEQLSLFVLAISDTGDRKSNTFKILRDAVIAAQNEYFALNEDNIAQSRLEFMLLKKKLDSATREITSSEDSEITFEYIKRLEKQVREFEVLVAPKLLMDDATSEKLIQILDSQGGSVAVASPEGGLFSTLKTAVVINPTFDCYLKAYTGDSIEVERLSRKGNMIENPRLSLIIASQPKTAMEMIQNKTFRDKGLPARFLFASCQSLVGTRTFDKPEVSTDAIEAYNNLIRKLLEGVFDRNVGQTELTLTPDGFSAYVDFSQSVESKLGNTGEYKFMQDWCAKLPGQMLRIAGIIAVCDGKVQIDVDIINRASTIAAWFMEHAAIVFGEDSVSEGKFSTETLAQFLDECAILEKTSSVKTAELLKHYNAWALKYDYETATSQKLCSELRKNFFIKHTKKGNVVNGIRLKN